MDHDDEVIEPLNQIVKYITSILMKLRESKDCECNTHRKIMSRIYICWELYIFIYIYTHICNKSIGTKFI